MEKLTSSKNSRLSSSTLQKTFWGLPVLPERELKASATEKQDKYTGRNKDKQTSHEF
jgi:hypothetical protein